MQVTIPQLLALPLAFVISYAIAFPLTHKSIQYKWLSVESDLRYIAWYLAEHSGVVAECDDPVMSVNQWLAGTADPLDPFSQKMGVPPAADPWGNAYQATLVPDKDIGVFCLGHDGTSASEGNDEDDINSWSDDPPRHYLRGASTHQLPERLLATAGILPFVYCPMWLLLSRRSRRDPTDTQEST